MNNYISHQLISLARLILQTRFTKRIVPALVMIAMPILLLFGGIFATQAMGSSELTPSLVADINVGSDDSQLQYLTILDDKLYFGAEDGLPGINLYVHDPVVGSTSVVAGVAPDLTVHAIVTFQNKIYFSGDDGVLGRELWVHDPSVPTTTLAADINVGSGDSRPTNLTVLDDKLYFNAYVNTYGSELWVYDPATGAATLAADINPGRSTSSPNYITAFNDKLYFAAYRINQQSLIAYDPDTETFDTVFTGARSPNYLEVLDGKLYFAANHSAYGTELWVHDPVSDTTTLVEDIAPNSYSGTPQAMTAFEGKLYFNAGDLNDGRELWVHDPVANTTNIVADIHPTDGSVIHHMGGLNGKLYFIANDGVNGYEIWEHDPVALTTVLFAEIVDGPSGSNPREFTALNDRLYFAADDGVHGSELWTLAPLPDPIFINFQPSEATRVTGYLVDAGDVLGDRGNGQTYGWDVDNRAWARDRNWFNFPPDQRYDTFNHLQLNGQDLVWEIALADGFYLVHGVAGDAEHMNLSQRIDAEGSSFIDGVPTEGQYWVGGATVVEVTDGFLTLENNSNATGHNKLDYLQIYPMGSGSVGFNTKINFQTAVSSTVAGYEADDGSIYGLRSNGLTYGWDVDNRSKARDRNNVYALDERYDSLNHMQPGGQNRLWEIEVPNGNYAVTVAGGDPLIFTSGRNYAFSVEGVEFIDADGEPGGRVNSFLMSGVVMVEDGRLTIANSPNSLNNKIQFVEITQID